MSCSVQVSVGASHDNCMLLMHARQCHFVIDACCVMAVTACLQKPNIVFTPDQGAPILLMERVPRREAKSPEAVIRTIIGQIGPMICRCDRTP